MANTTFTATTTSQIITDIWNNPKVLQITNMGTNPVTIRFAEAWSAVFGVWIVLPFQYSTFSFDNRDLFNYQETTWATSVITTWGNSALAIFHL